MKRRNANINQVGDIVWAPSTEKATLPNAVAFREGGHPELVRVTFSCGAVEDLLTLRCNEHIKCHCGTTRILKMINLIETPRAKRIRSFGKPISYQSFVTRIIPSDNKSGQKTFVDRYRIFTEVHQDIEQNINDMLLKVEAIKAKTYQFDEEDTEAEKSICKLRKSVKEYIIEHGHLVNIYPLESLAEYRDIWGKSQS